MKTTVTEAAAEALYADDWRLESTILDGARLVKDLGGVYATIIPSPDYYSWTIWEWLTGSLIASGREDDVTEAADAAHAWVQKEWLTSGD